MTVFSRESSQQDYLETPCFFGNPVAIARFDRQRYPIFEKLTKQQLGFFWMPEEVDLVRDSKDFKGLTPHEQHIFTSNIKRQILLDSVQGRAPTQAFAPICSQPELENWIQTWAFNETIHSRSYTHVIRNVYSNPSFVFDQIMDIAEIVDCAKDISKHYDSLIFYNNQDMSQLPEYYHAMRRLQHKKALWMALMSVNILEGVRFYVSFACSWAFAEVKKMEGNAKIIKLICRDENVHLAGTQHLLKILQQEDADFAKIAQETREECVELFRSAAEQEIKWADFLFKDGSMIGLNAELLQQYVHWITNRRMHAVGLPSLWKTGANPLPWTQKWISGSDVQVAPQETQITSYIVGGTNRAIDKGKLSSLTL